MTVVSLTSGCARLTTGSEALDVIEIFEPGMHVETVDKNRNCCLTSKVRIAPDLQFLIIATPFRTAIFKCYYNYSELAH
jgi:hypothetical protein